MSSLTELKHRCHSGQDPIIGNQDLFKQAFREDAKGTSEFLRSLFDAQGEYWQLHRNRSHFLPWFVRYADETSRKRFLHEWWSLLDRALDYEEMSVVFLNNHFGDWYEFQTLTELAHLLEPPHPVLRKLKTLVSSLDDMSRWGSSHFAGHTVEGSETQKKSIKNNYRAVVDAEYKRLLSSHSSEVAKRFLEEFWL